jgi:hypothetical protein
MTTPALFEVPAAAHVSVPRHPSGERFSVQVFALEDTDRTYIGLPIRSLWTPSTAHLFTRETAERIVWDLNTWDADWGVSGEFAEDGTLTFWWTAAFYGDDLGGCKSITPDPWGRYLIGGIWDWDDPHDDIHVSEEKGAFLRGAAEYRQTDAAASLPEDLRAAYALGRAESHRLTLHLDDTPEGAMRAALAEYGVTAYADDDCGNSWLRIPLDQGADFDGTGPQIDAYVMVEGSDELFVDEPVGIQRAHWHVALVDVLPDGRGASVEEWFVAASYETEAVAGYIAEFLTRP